MKKLSDCRSFQRDIFVTNIEHEDKNSEVYKKYTLYMKDNTRKTYVLGTTTTMVPVIKLDFITDVLSNYESGAEYYLLNHFDKTDAEALISNPVLVQSSSSFSNVKKEYINSIYIIKEYFDKVYVFEDFIE